VELYLCSPINVSGRDIAQAVSRRHPAAQFDPRSGHVGFLVDKVALGQIFSGYFGFPSQVSFHRLLHTHLSSGAIGPLVAGIPNELSFIQSHKLKQKKKLEFGSVPCFGTLPDFPRHHNP
jgi:hypothetical protein